MSKVSLPRPLRGVIPPLATPLLDRDRLDHAGLGRLIEHVLGGGVHGLFVLGTTGEAPGLSHRLRCELVERACAQVAGRVPVLVGITDTSFTESVEMAEHAADNGAAAVVVAPPYYFPAGQPELVEYVEHIAAEVPLPLFLYNMPSHTKISFELETIQRTLHIPNIVGLKDSSGQMVYFHKVRQMIAARPDFSLLIGPEELLPDAVLAGAHGGVCGGANLAPRLYVDLYEAALCGDLARVRELHARVLGISMTIYSAGPYWSAFVKGLKCALACLGICEDFVAEPFQRFGPAERERIDRYLRELGLKEEAVAAQLR
ncbi:MAG TPA: dihydrodipicolinate synthase family protein [Gemmataceae bacterium]|nr:dihydrodipicolinate synthase family protein [Gemmataceae bacterium]